MSEMNFFKLKFIQQKTMIKNRNLFFKNLLNALCVTVKTRGDGGRTEVRGRSQTTFKRFWLFLTTYPLVFTLSMFLVYKKWTFWTTYLPSLVNIVCERPLTFSLISVSSVMEFLLWWLKISWIFVQQIFVIYESANLHNMTFLLALVSVLTILIFETLHFQNDFCHL